MNTEDTGKLVLRVALGLLILLHGIFKLQHGVGAIAGMLTGHGLPGVFAYGVYVGEVVAPALMIAGFYTRVAALVVAINMIVALALAHANELFALNAMGGSAIELQAMFLFAAVAVALLGAGRFSVGGLHGRFN